MAEISLPMPASEEKFWSQVAYRWASTAGLLLVVVPDDVNTLSLGKWVRDRACWPPGSDLAVAHPPPDYRSTYCYSLSNGAGPVGIHGAELLPRVLEDIGRTEVAAQSARGGPPFLLVITGAEVSRGASLNRWVGGLVRSWPGSRPGAPLTRFHLCCLVTAPWPGGTPPLPDGCDCLLLGDTPEEEILSIARESVETCWAGESEHLRRYVLSAIVDMASGRRPHAELALEWLVAAWDSGRARTREWRPQWDLESTPVAEVRELLGDEGVTLSSLQCYLYGGPDRRDDMDSSEVASRLWARGMWCRHPDTGSFWHGLTSLARAALRPANTEDWLLPYFVPDSTVSVMRRCMQIEQQIKYLLWHLMQAAAGRARVREVLDRPSSAKGYEGMSRRDRVAAQMVEIGRDLSPERMRSDDVVVSTCGFGTIPELLSDLIPLELHRSLIPPLIFLVRMRNRAAHGRWFSLSEYLEVCQQADRVEAALSYFRIS